MRFFCTKESFVAEIFCEMLKKCVVFNGGCKCGVISVYFLGFFDEFF